MQTLYSLRKESFDHICLPHSIDMNPESIIVHGKEKLEAYINYREERDRAIVQCFSAANPKADQGLSIDFLYELIYGPRNLPSALKGAAMNNLELHLAKL